ncbi:hypothetical protein GCM10027406_00800 [Leifsonia lichenia]
MATRETVCVDTPACPATSASDGPRLARLRAVFCSVIALPFLEASALFGCAVRLGQLWQIRKKDLRHVDVNMLV